MKCRIEYDGKIRSIGFDPYRPKPVCVLRLVEAEGLDYSFKYSDRSRLDALNDAEPGHEVLIVQGERSPIPHTATWSYGKRGAFYSFRLSAERHQAAEAVAGVDCKRDEDYSG